MSDFKKKYLKYKNKYLKTKIMMYGGSRNFSIVDDISIRTYPNNLFTCQVYFKDPIRATKEVASVTFNSYDPEGDFDAYDETYFFTDLEILKMKAKARLNAYPKIEHLFDHNELKKFYERLPVINQKLTNEIIMEKEMEKEEELQKKRREEYERERPERERIRKLEEEKIMRKLEKERIFNSESERIRKLTEEAVEENRRKNHKIRESLEKKILSKNIDSAIDEYKNIEQSLNEDDKETIKTVFYYYIREVKYNIEKVELLLNLDIINGQKIINWYIKLNLPIPLDILELLLSRSNENLEFPERIYISDEKKKNLSNNLKRLLDKYKIDYN